VQGDAGGVEGPRDQRILQPGGLFGLWVSRGAREGETGEGTVEGVWGGNRALWSHLQTGILIPALSCSGGLIPLPISPRSPALRRRPLSLFLLSKAKVLPALGLWAGFPQAPAWEPQELSPWLGIHLQQQYI